MQEAQISAGEITAGGVIGIILAIAFALFYLITVWKLYGKAGQPGWGILVPIYNIILWLKLAGKPAWWIIWFITPALPIIYILGCIGIAKNFGKGTGFGIGLWLLGMIFYPVLAFGSADYQPA